MDTDKDYKRIKSMLTHICSTAQHKGYCHETS